MMKESLWVLGKNIFIGKKSGRFLVEIDGVKNEIAALKLRTIIVSGRVEATSRALELAFRNDVSIILLEDKLLWLYKSFPEKDVSLLLNLYKYSREIVEELSKAAEFNRKEVSRKFTRGVDIGKAILSTKKCSLEDLLRLSLFLDKFLVGESLDFLLKTGLTPITSNNIFLPKLIAEVFKPIALQVFLLKKMSSRMNLEDFGVLKWILADFKKHLKETVISDLEGYSKNIIEHMEVCVKSLAMFLRNPVAREFKAFRMGV
ncbi:MAG: CRISPR-associated endonuclease Cas1 [Thermoproteales archaeon]|nr:CRISPR-associated endonuclease Cas1 [Thermoproteales archaeon]